MTRYVSSSFDTLVGIRGDTIILTSEHTLYCLDWRHYDPAPPGAPAAPDPLAPPITRWHTLMPTPLRGRPCLTARELLVPCQGALYRLNPDTGNITATYPPPPPTPNANPANPAWKSPAEPGNVLAIGDETIIAGANAVSVYRDHP